MDIEAIMLGTGFQEITSATFDARLKNI